MFGKRCMRLLEDTFSVGRCLQFIDGKIVDILGNLRSLSLTLLHDTIGTMLTNKISLFLTKTLEIKILIEIVIILNSNQFSISMYVIICSLCV